jgi:hypothetical protein
MKMTEEMEARAARIEAIAARDEMAAIAELNRMTEVADAVTILIQQEVEFQDDAASGSRAALEPVSGWLYFEQLRNPYLLGLYQLRAQVAARLCRMCKCCGDFIEEGGWQGVCDDCHSPATVCYKCYTAVLPEEVKWSYDEPWTLDGDACIVCGVVS